MHSHTHARTRAHTQALVTLLSLSAAMCFRGLFARFALLRTAKESVILKKSACRRFCSVLVRCIAAPDPHLPHLPSTIKHGWTMRVGDFGSYSLRPPLLFGRLNIFPLDPKPFFLNTFPVRLFKCAVGTNDSSLMR